MGKGHLFKPLQEFVIIANRDISSVDTETSSHLVRMLRQWCSKFKEAECLTVHTFNAFFLSEITVKCNSSPSLKLVGYGKQETIKVLHSHT